MVIARGNGIIFVTLADGEYLPENMNNIKVVVFRQGDSTNRELKVIKPLGALAGKELLKPPTEPMCNYDGNGNPLHQHTDGGWWFYEETWSMESGPFETEELGHTALVDYCEKLQAAREQEILDLTETEECEIISHDENNELQAHTDGDGESSDSGPSERQPASDLESIS
jgi:hypothetical protein